MKKYNPDETCCKCGSGEIEDEYQIRQTKGIWISPPPEAWVPEHIARTCKNCGYLWQEAPLDSFDPEKAREAQKVREKVGHAPRKLKSEDLPDCLSRAGIIDEADTPEADEALESIMANSAIEVGDVVYDSFGNIATVIGILVSEEKGLVAGLQMEKDFPPFRTTPFDNLTLIRKGPKVHIKEVKGRYVTVFDNRGIQVDNLDFDEDTILNITVTKKEV
jgi:hypothetical protein